MTAGIDRWQREAGFIQGQCRRQRRFGVATPAMGRHDGRHPGFGHPFRRQAAMDSLAQDGQQTDRGDKS